MTPKHYTSCETYGRHILHRGIDTDGRRFAYKVEYRPTLFVTSDVPSEYKSLYGENLKPIQPGNMKDCREFIQTYEGVDGFKVHGFDRFQFAFISDNYPDEIEWSMQDIRVVNIDIETTCEHGFPNPDDPVEEVVVITLKDGDKYHVFGTKPYQPSNPKVIYYLCQDEKELLTCFIDQWRIISPDIITGWNCGLFDLPYLIKRIIKILEEKEARRLSIWGNVREERIKIFNREVPRFKIGGVSILDYIDLYKKFTYQKQESYKLDYIASVELGMKKLDYEEYDSIASLYKGEISASPKDEYKDKSDAYRYARLRAIVDGEITKRNIK